MPTFKPLLAATCVPADIKFPVLASLKLDGIRCVVINGKALTRSLKPIPNNFIRESLEAAASVLEGVDGELIVGNTFSETTSAVMRITGEPDFTFHVFDRVIEGNFITRFTSLSLTLVLPKFCTVVEHHYVINQADLDLFYGKALTAGHEGVMLRSACGRYKCGRSTVREGILLKLKPFADSEATIVGFEELMHNDNESVTNELGRTARSSCKAGKTPGGTLGKFIVVGLDDKHFGGVQFSVGTGSGLTAALRQHVWDNQADYLGKILKFKYQEIGSIDSPRIPVAQGFRDLSDM